MNPRSVLGTLALGLLLSSACSKPTARAPNASGSPGPTTSSEASPRVEPSSDLEDRTERALGETPSEARTERASPRAAEPRDEPRDDDEQALFELERAAHQLRQFLEKAGDQPEYEESVAKARERLDELEQTIAAVEEGLLLKRARQSASGDASTSGSDGPKAAP